MTYLDSSSLLKLVWDEPESATVIDAIASESTVVVSVLAEIETLVQLKAAHLGGEYTLPRLRQLEAHLAVLRNKPPFEFRNLSGAVFRTALRQHRNSGRMHCRSLDRLHLAAMEELRIMRLITNDASQADAATEAGFEVIQPGRS